MTTLKGEIQDAYNRLLSGGSDKIQELLKINIRKKEGRELIALCPFCDDSSGHLYISTDKPVYHCFKCESKGDYLDYMTKTKGLGLDFITAVKELGRVSGMEITINEAKYQENKKRAGLLERTQMICQKRLNSPEGKDVMDYLTQRGYTPDEIKDMELGAYDKNYLESELKKYYTNEEIRDSKILTLPEEYKLSLVWKSVSGRVSGIQGRLIDNRDLPKYRYISGHKRDTSFIGLDRARQNKDKDIFIVEGALDALYLNSKGIGKQFIAIGDKGKVSTQQIKGLKDAGIKNIILSLDPDARENSLKILHTLLREQFNVRVLDMLDETYKDMEELVRKEGINSLTSKAKVSHFSSWIIKTIAGKYDTSDPEGLGYINALHESLKYYPDLSGVDKKRYLKALTDKYDLSPEEIQEELLKVEDHEEDKKALEKIKELSRQLSGVKDIDSALSLLEDAQDKVTRQTGLEVSEPYFIEEFFDDMERADEGLRTGYQVLDDLITIPQDSLTIIAGRPAHGKTSLMLNLLLNMTELYPDKTFIFYSFEMSKKDLMLRLSMIMSEYEGNNRQNTNYFKYYLKNRRRKDFVKEIPIEDALRKCSQLVKEGRLLLICRPLTDRQLSRDIKKLTQRGDIGAVFVDYLQRVKPEADNSQRYMDIKRVSDTLLQTAIQNEIAVIAGAQFKRENGNNKTRPSMDSLREGGDIEQDASLILGLYNPAVDNKKEDQAVSYTDNSTTIEVDILKNRNGSTRREIELKFKGSVYKITE